MKIDVDCTIEDGEAEISISLLDRISREEFDEFTDIMRREGFEYDAYSQSNCFRTSRASMLSAMLKFLDKEFEVSGVLRGDRKYSWDERDQFITDFSASLSQGRNVPEGSTREASSDAAGDIPEQGDSTTTS
jgi:hypothetical protein